MFDSDAPATPLAPWTGSATLEPDGEVLPAGDWVSTHMAFSLSMDAGVISSDFTYNAPSGLSVVDIETGNGNDFLIENATLVIDGPANSFVIFRLPDGTNLNVSNGNILVGDGGIGLNNVLFVSDSPDNDPMNFPIGVRTACVITTSAAGIGAFL